jgi:hypothetical protein
MQWYRGLAAVDRDRGRGAPQREMFRASLGLETRRQDGEGMSCF